MLTTTGIGSLSLELRTCTLELWYPPGNTNVALTVLVLGEAFWAICVSSRWLILKTSTSFSWSSAARLTAAVGHIGVLTLPLIQISSSSSDAFFVHVRYPSGARRVPAGVLRTIPVRLPNLTPAQAPAMRVRTPPMPGSNRVPAWKVCPIAEHNATLLPETRSNTHPHC